MSGHEEYGNTHLNEEQLVAHFFGDAAAHVQVESHLAACAACRAEFESIKATMNLVDGMDVPRRDERYAAEVWNSVGQSLGLRKKRLWTSWFTWQRVSAVGATAGLVVLAFLAGRQYPQTNAPAPVAGVVHPDEPLRQRLLLVTLVDHLEQSQRMLTEVSNSRVDELPVERESAAQLVAANRLYRMSAKESGDRNMTLILDTLERYLIEAAHSSPEELESLQRRMAEDDILFQLRVVNGELKQRQRKMLPVESN